MRPVVLRSSTTAFSLKRTPWCSVALKRREWVSALPPSVSRPLTTPARPLHTSPRTHRPVQKQEEKQRENVPMLTCPECGKRFFRASNLNNHRRHRHLVSLPDTPPKEELEAREEVARLREELRTIRKETRELKRLRQKELRGKDGSTTTTTTTATPSSSSLPSFPVAVASTKPYHVSAAEWEEWNQSTDRVGTTARWTAVGRVQGPVEYGILEADRPSSSPDPNAAAAEAMTPYHGQAPLLLQFQLEVQQHITRALGQLKGTRATLLIRYRFPYQGDTSSSSSAPTDWKKALRTVKEGDLVRIQGYYALHHSWDMVSKKLVENVVVEAETIHLLPS